MYVLFWPFLVDETAFVLPLQTFLANIRFEPLFGIQFHEPTILLLKLLHALHQRYIDAAALGSPLAKGRFNHAVLAAQSCYLSDLFILFEDRRVWLSVYRDFFIENYCVQFTEILYF